MSASNRDLRIDFLRGGALLMIFIDHSEVFFKSIIFSKYTLKAFGFSDGAELFVFISGYVFAIVYGNLFLKAGYWKCQKKSFFRCFQIYLAYITTYIVIACISYFFNFDVILQFKTYAMNLLLTSFTKSFFYSATMVCPLFNLDLFALYIFFLLMMTPLLYVHQKNIMLAAGISFTLYLFAQINPHFNIPRYPIDGHFYWGEGRYFNYFAWQFMFFIGLLCGSRIHNGNAPPSTARHSFILTLSIMMILFSYCLKFVFPTLSEFDNSQFISRLDLDYEASWVSAKRTLGPLRILHLLSLLYFLNWAFPSLRKLENNLLVKLIITCGQHSLFVYSISTIFVYLVIPYSYYLGNDFTSILIYDVTCIALLLLLAVIRHHFKQKTPSALIADKY